ncbi:MAG: nickel pincer cofactor biosynthesis protein LarC [Actinomycetota bacterium]|nr:nickel pincer cofactor biosynthesis protein LarC [Actinomycetota bacterium]
MTLAALIAAGTPLAKLSCALSTLNVSFELHTDTTEVSGIQALRVEVEYPEQHVHRTFADIRRLVEDAGLPERAVLRSVAAFRLLAEAEGTVHGRPPEDVTFHEVGAVDSIIDVVGSCVALELLEADTVSCGLLPMGTGVVPSAHGPLPVPGPATLAVLKGSRVRWTAEPTETTTPTGAALMASLTGGTFTEAAPPMVLGSVGYGAGRATLQHAPNLLRAVVGEIEGASGSGELELLEANVDDAPGEILGAAVETLLTSGALDAWLEPITMKKGRGAYKVCALVESKKQADLTRLLMKETGSLGVRHLRAGRTVAERRAVDVQLPYGICRVKVGSLDGEDFIAAPEYEDAARLARENGLSLPRVYADARVALREHSARD